MLTRIKSLLLRLFESSNFIIITGVLTILPFIIISIFNNPSADDFCYNNYTRDLGYLKTQVEAYNNWTGRYCSTAIISIKAFLSGSFVIYKIFPIFLLIVFIQSIHHLCSAIFISLSKKNRFVLTFLITILYFLQMESTAEGFYWLAGSVTYQLSIISSVFLFSFLIKLLETSQNKYLLYSILLSFVVVGLNEIAMMYSGLIIGTIFLYNAIAKHNINYKLLFLLVFICICSAFVVLSPGSASRVNTYPGNQQLIYSFLKTLNAFKTNIGNWLPSILIAFLLFFEHLQKEKVKINSNIFDVKLILPFLIVAIFPLIGVFPIYYSLKWVPARSLNLIYFFFLIGLLYLAFVLFFRLKKNKTDFLTFSKWTRIFLMVLVLIRLGGNNNIRTAYVDLLSGKAYAYDQALKKRYEIILKNKSKQIVVPQLENLPKTIHFEDIRDNSNHWINQCYESYFYKKEIRIIPSKP
ncbi:DUF6056 family protein [Flavobacterium sp. GNP002]